MDTRTWEETEARFQRARAALREAQDRHGEAAQEFLLARAEVRQMLEAVFPGTEKVGHPLVVTTDFKIGGTTLRNAGVVYALPGNTRCEG